MAELGTITSPEVAGAAPTILVPLGSTEQHGPHLPLDTDTRIAAAVATALCADGVLLAPTIPYGASGEHQEFPGTISIGTEALTVLLVEYGRSACQWAARVLFVNGHGGNIEALRAAVALLRTEGRDVAWFACGVQGADLHAGHTETSLLLHLSPQQVRSRHGVTGNTAPLAELLPALRSGGVGAVSDSGVLGDPSAASAADGQRHLAAMVGDCAARLTRWQPGPDGMLT